MKKETDFYFCFQQDNGSNIHKLYIYDNVSEYGALNWSTWEYEESQTSAKYFRDQLEAIPEEHTIELHINSNGGSVKEGVAIYNLLKRHRAQKIGYVDGVAYSIAFVILQACNERIMGVGTSALIHNMWIETWGNADQLRKEADDLDVLMESNRKIFMERAKGISEEELKKKMEAETYLTPDQCVEYGFCDKVESMEGEEKGQQTQQALQQAIQEMKVKLMQQQTFRNELNNMYKELREEKTVNEVKEEIKPEKSKMQEIFERIAKNNEQ
ncbi:head maturation protease, ClpP-related [Diplocloster modestus]|uniref:ATP-dependent Clp protease proteolytic subunit n=1 Tax=Diplocloster modestus TaxID=2850322 RepID=A0ABS6KCP1_9FIRM|nr:Clp protease ClpP [Diplocloster modestus]